MGSTFAVELLIYNRSMDHQVAAREMETTSVVSLPRTLQARSHARPTTVVRVVPCDYAPEVMIEHSDSGIEGAAETLSILIVDDSSANRSG